MAISFSLVLAILDDGRWRAQGLGSLRVACVFEAFAQSSNPQAALIEMRRVTRDGGVVFLAPQWDCPPWAADGYPVRPFRDFGWREKIYKASIPFQNGLW